MLRVSPLIVPVLRCHTTLLWLNQFSARERREGTEGTGRRRGEMERDGRDVQSGKDGGWVIAVKSDIRARLVHKQT